MAGGSCCFLVVTGHKLFLKPGGKRAVELQLFLGRDRHPFHKPKNTKRTNSAIAQTMHQCCMHHSAETGSPSSCPMDQDSPDIKYKAGKYPKGKIAIL